MCGRFVRKKSAEQLALEFEVAENHCELAPSFNIAPTQQVATVVFSPRRQQTELHSLAWGLIPSWAKDASIASKLINARSETLLEKPSFKDSFRKRRCLIVADGFYEWKPGGDKQPQYIHLEPEQTFTFAGLYDFWKTPEGKLKGTCTIITTEANDKIRPIHHRMPVIVRPEWRHDWLNPSQKAENLQNILQPWPAEQLNFFAVNPAVNSTRFNQPECLDPVV